ncbi:DUF2634 domain-containing protein [Paenibacillus agilis]|uniref:DUF2634 domain-containing protein n=1 Tax=Paenibacillus agilis TaxID=3020863 RepID=A0A559IX84_9BACL|nr:DUF2634 domain-containing protein [Paenibacillus agilis]TVX92229.1 DUF2634 domain-containing protein [Paenibacillus agilis]
MDDLKTPVFDWDTGDFLVDLQGRIVTATGAEAVEQIVMKATQTIRGLFLIYANLEEPELDHKYGNDAVHTLVMDMPNSAKISELKRNILDALVYDPWINDVTDIEIEQRQDDKGEWAYYGNATIHHVFGTSEIAEVTVANG